MKNLLLALILANVLYFLWGTFQSDKDLPPGVARLKESDLGPPLDGPKVADDKAPAGEPDPQADQADPGDESANTERVVAETADSGQTGEKQLNVALGRSCVTLGPFRQGNRADDVQSEMAAQGMRAELRLERGEIFVGHWVQIRDIPDRAVGDEAVMILQEGGIPEAYLVTTDDTGLKISLGVFGNRDGAERVHALAQSLGFPSEITPRTADGLYHFVDVALPPGQGAGAIIERYGEELVRMREVSSCPQP
jgi:hypothetical protein